MLLDLRTAVITVSLILASIAVAAAAESLQEPPSQTATVTAQRAPEATPIRVILAAPWEPASTATGARTLPQK